MSKNNENEFSGSRLADNSFPFDHDNEHVNEDGTQAEPTIGFASDPNSGFYKYADGEMGYSSNDYTSNRFTRDGIISSRLQGGSCVVNAGSASGPTMVFALPGHTGFYQDSSGVVGFSSNQTNTVKFNSMGITLNNNGVIDNGSTESITFSASDIKLKTTNTTRLTVKDAGVDVTGALTTNSNVILPTTGQLTNGGNEALVFTGTTTALQAEGGVKLTAHSTGVDVTGNIALTGGINIASGGLISTFLTGTYTPALDSIAHGGFTHGARNGYYYRINNMVTVVFDIIWTAVPRDVFAPFPIGSDYYVRMTIPVGTTASGSGVVSILDKYDVGPSTISTAIHVYGERAFLCILKDNMDTEYGHVYSIHESGNMYGTFTYYLT
jgi:hypothetical protein